MPKKPPPDAALYVRIPVTTGDKLDRAAEMLGVHKKDLVAGLLDRYIDTDSRRGLSALGSLSQPRKISIDLGEPSATLGSYSFQPHDPPEVMSADQAAAFLQIEEKLVVELAEAGDLPGRKLGKAWRFSRAALVAWLAAAEAP